MDKQPNECELENRSTVTSAAENSIENKIESVNDENDKNILRNLLLNKKIDEQDKNIKDNDEGLIVTNSNDYLNQSEDISMKDAQENIPLKQNNDVEVTQAKEDESLRSESDVEVTQGKEDESLISESDVEVTQGKADESLRFESDVELENNANESSINVTQITNTQSSLIENVNNISNEQNINEPSEFCKLNIQNMIQSETLSDNSIKMNIDKELMEESTNSENMFSNTSNINSQNVLNKDNLEENINEDILQACGLQIKEKKCELNVDISNTLSIKSNDESGSKNLSLENCDNENSSVKLVVNLNNMEFQNESLNENICSSSSTHSNIIKENIVNLLEKESDFKQQSKGKNNNSLYLNNINPVENNFQKDNLDIKENNETVSRNTASLKEYLSTDIEQKRKSTNNETLLSSALSTSVSDTSRTSFTDESINKNSSYLTNESMDDSKICEIPQSSKIASSASTPKKSPVKNYLISSIPKFNQQDESSCDSNSSSNLVIDQEWDQKNLLKRKLSPRPTTNGETSPNKKHFHFNVEGENDQNKTLQVLDKIATLSVINEEKNQINVMLKNVNGPQINNNLKNIISNSVLMTNETEKPGIEYSINEVVKNNTNQDSGKLKISRTQTGKLQTNNKKTPRKRKKNKSENFMNNLAIDLTQPQNIPHHQSSYQAYTDNMRSEIQISEDIINQKSIYPLQNSQIGENYPVQFMNHQQMKPPYDNLQKTELRKNKQNREHHNAIIQSQQLIQFPNRIFESPQKNKILPNNAEHNIQQHPLLNYQLLGQQFLPSNSSQSFQNGPLFQNHLQPLNSIQRIENNCYKPISNNYYQISPDTPPQLQIVSQMIQQAQPNNLQQQAQPMAYSQSSYQQPIYQYQISNELPMQLIEEPQSNIVQYKCFRCLTASFPTIQDLQEHQKYCLFRNKVLQPSQNIQVQSACGIMPSENINMQLHGQNADFISSNELANQYNFDNTKKSLEEQKRQFFLCSACGTYHQDWNLFLHMRKIHRKYICLYCMGLFPNGQQLTKHLEIKHNLEKHYFNSQFELLKSCKGSSYFLMCSNCEYMFNENEDFYEHICTEFMQHCLHCAQKGNNNNDCICKYSTHNNIALKKTKKNKNHKLSNLNQKYLKNINETLDKSNIPTFNNTSEQIDSDDGGNYLEHFNYNDNDLINLYKSNRNLLKQKEEQKQRQDSVTLEKTSSTAQFIEPTNLGIGADQEKYDSLVVPKIKLIIPKEYQNKPTIESEESSTESEMCDEISLTKSNIIDEENTKIDETPNQNVSSESKNDSDMDIDVTCTFREEFLSETQPCSSVEMETIRKDLPSSELSDNAEFSYNSEIQNTDSKSFDNTGTVIKTPEQKMEILSNTISIETEKNADTDRGADEIAVIAGTAQVIEKEKPVDGIELADDDCAVQELALDAPLDKIPMVQFLRICLQATHSMCLYCYHARRIAVNGNSLALHLLAQHRFSATVDSITAEELQPQTIVAKLKSFLLELNDYYFNMESYCNVAQNASTKLTNEIDESQFECFQCRFVTKIHKELYVHNRKMHLKTAILCYMCRSNFYSYSDILCHICPGAPNKQIIFDIKFRCCLCDLDNIPSAFRLMVHLRKKHLACDVCLEYCYDQSRLSSHVWKHKLHHFCYRCVIAYRNKPDITKHLFWKHGTESVLCRRCLQKRWPYVYHFCIPPSTFVCEICQLTFSQAMYLKVHKRLHSGEEPYPCTEDNCNKKFISKKILLKHINEHSAPPRLNLIQENKQENDVSLTTNNIDDLKEKDENCKNETLSKEKEKHEPRKKNSSKKKRKKSKREPKELLADLNLQAPNLSESGSSDSDSDSESISKKNVKEAVPIQIENEFVPSVMLSPASELGDDGASESEQKIENQDKTLDIWKNFENFQATQKSQSVSEVNIDKPKLESPVLRAVQSDHDYCTTFKSSGENSAANKTPENNETSTNSKVFDGLNEFIKFDSNSGEISPVKSKKAKSPKKHHESGNDSESSSSSSSSDSDSSCSCGSNCSCSSGSSSSSSHSSSSTDSDDSSSSSQEKKKSSTPKRVAREERRQNRKEEEIIKNSSTEIVDVVTDDVLLDKLEPIILESDLATEESDSDEDFYDDHPRKIANHMLDEKRKQLMQQMSPIYQNNFYVMENSRPSTPFLPVEEITKEKRSKGKKKKRKPSNKPILQSIKLNGSEMMDSQQILEFVQNSSSIMSAQTNEVNVLLGSEISEGQLLPPPRATTHINHNVLLNTSCTKSGQIYHNRLSTESSSDAGKFGTTINSLKRSKRARRPNRFYGYSSDDDHHHLSVPNLYSGALKPTPPPQFKWSKEDLPSPSKSILSHKNNKTNLSGKKIRGSRISKKKENSTNKLKMRLSKSMGKKLLPPIPTLKIRPSDIFPQIPPSPLDYQPPRPRPQLEKPQPSEYDLNTGPIVQSVVNLPPVATHHIDNVPSKLFDTSRTGDEDDEDSSSSDDDKLTIPAPYPYIPQPNKENDLSLQSFKPPVRKPSEQGTRRIPPPLLPNPDYSVIQYCRRHNIRFPIRAPDGARGPREGESVYCYCRCPYDEVSEMIACDGDECMIEWFHFECIGIFVAPQGKWYCPECKGTANSVVVPDPKTLTASTASAASTASSASTASTSIKFEYFNRS